MIARVGPVTVVSGPAESALALSLAKEAARSTAWPGLTLRTPPPLRLVLVPNTERLGALSRGKAPTWGAAVAFPDSRTIVLRADAGDPSTLLRHELAHLALHDAVSVRLPLWFDEGYAVWAAGEWSGFDALALNLTVARGGVPSFQGLDRGLREATSVGVAYTLASSAVLELARRSREQSLVPLLARLQAGGDFDASVQATTGLTIAQFERVWQQAVRRRYSLAAWAVAGGAWGVIALAVFLVRRLRRRTEASRRAALDEGWEIPGELDRTEIR